MKKYMFVGFAAAMLAGCGNKTETFIGAECEKIAKGENGDYVLKCPITPELAMVQQQEPNAMFASVNPTEYATDAEHIYVNVVPNNCGENVPGYRVLVKEPVFEEGKMYAVSFCIQQ